jgi:hypothetical protein
MKKIFLLTFLVAITISLFAQDRTVPFVFSQDNQYLAYTGESSLDRVSSTKDSLAILFTLNKTYPVQYDGLFIIDSVSTPRVLIYLQGKKFANDSWTTITSIIYTGTTSATHDTTIRFSLVTEPTSTLLFDTTKYTAGVYRHDLYSATQTQTSVSKYYRQFRILFVRTAGTAKLQEFEWKFWQRQY